MNEIINNAKATDIPLIYTSKGNYPIDALDYKSEWILNSEYIMFIEKWFYDEEEVKSNVHAYALKPIGDIGATIPTF